MRIARLLGLVLAALTVGILLAPTASGQPPFRLPSYVNDGANALSGSEFSDVQQAVDKLYSDRHIRLWVVYVDTFSGQDAVGWTQQTRRLSDIGSQDAILAVATGDRAYAFLPPTTGSGGFDVTSLRTNEIEPKLRQSDWAGAAIAAAQGLDPTTSTTTNADISWFGLLVAFAVLALVVLVVWLWLRRRKRKRREAEFAAARRVDPADPNALASVPIDALDDLSKSIVVDVDNAVRTSDNELGLAVDEFGPDETAPFNKAVASAKTTLAQAFNVRQILDDAVPETVQQRRDLLTRVVVAAAKADRELDAQREAFEQLRDLVINAPSRLDTLTQQMVDVTARIAPSEQALAALHKQYSDTALASVAGNVETAKQRLAFADQNLTNARTLVARPVGRQTGLIDSIRGAESALGQARTLLDAIESAGTDMLYSSGTTGKPKGIKPPLPQRSVEEPGDPIVGMLESVYGIASDDVYLMSRMALSGVGVAQLPLHVCDSDIRQGRLVILLPDHALPDHQLHAVYPTRRGMVPGVKAFIDLLAAELPKVMQRAHLDFQAAMAGST